MGDAFSENKPTSSNIGSVSGVTTVSKITTINLHWWTNFQKNQEAATYNKHKNQINTRCKFPDTLRLSCYNYYVDIDICSTALFRNMVSTLPVVLIFGMHGGFISLQRRLKEQSEEDLLHIPTAAIHYLLLTLVFMYWYFRAFRDSAREFKSQVQLIYISALKQLLKKH